MNYLWIIRLYEIVGKVFAHRGGKNKFVFLLLINIIEIDWIWLDRGNKGEVILKEK